MRQYIYFCAVLYVTAFYGFGIVKGDFVVSDPFNATEFLVAGVGATVDNSVIRVTLGASDTGGVVIYNTLQDIANGFVTEFTYQSFECDPYKWNGADGYYTHRCLSKPMIFNLYF